MKEIALHIADLIQNSVKAGSNRIVIEVWEDTVNHITGFSIADNGCGMDSELLRNVTDPFVTTRTTRKVGLGISLTKAACEQTGGRFEITSKVNKGTAVKTVFMANHIDCQPLGDVSQTIYTVIMANTDIDFSFKYIRNSDAFLLDTAEIKKTLDGVGLTEPDVALWINEYIKEGINSIINQ